MSTENEDILHPSQLLEFHQESFEDDVNVSNLSVIIINTMKIIE